MISMTQTRTASAQPAYVPIALEEADIATYAAMAEALGCRLEDCAEGFMMATPGARGAAAMLWRGIGTLAERLGAEADGPEASALRTAAEPYRIQALMALRGLIGLDTVAMPHADLAAAGLRYAA